MQTTTAHSPTGSRAQAAPPRSTSPRAARADEAFQADLLQGVSRTFALTIPELPDELAGVVANGYLLCRIADTIEDEHALDWETKATFHERFAQVVAGEADAEAFARDLHPRLSSRTLAAERELVLEAPGVVAITHGFEAPQRDALVRCVRTMCGGMAEYGKLGRGSGLADLAALQDYCYYVAGCVGEMLTEIFCAYSPEIAKNRDALMQKGVSFGLGLQMTNILKDIWDDKARGFCWLPKDVFEAHGFDLEQLGASDSNAAFKDGLAELVAVTHGHLKNALEYTLLIPPQEERIRHFCLWALGMAVLTVRKINKRRGFRSTSDVKITRKSVRATILVSNWATKRDPLLRFVFTLLSVRLPGPKYVPLPR